MPTSKPNSRGRAGYRREEMRHIVVLGGGPKGVAIAAKAAALATTGKFAVPTITVIEKACVGAHWDGLHGYTNGAHRLGTPPEKDLGFPYFEKPFGAEVREEMLARYSWASYCVHGEGMAYHQWVDRGKPHPYHWEWASYLQWAKRRAEQVSTVRFKIGEVSRVRVEGGHLLITYRHSRGQAELSCDGLVVTGTGEPKTIPGQPASHPCIFDGRSFWLEGIKTLVPIVGRSQAFGAFILGVVVCRSLAGSTVKYAASHAGVEIIYPGLFASIGFVIIAVVLPWLAILLVAMVAKSWALLIAPLLRLVFGHLPAFVFMRYAVMPLLR
jgi:hypothetical protein